MAALLEYNLNVLGKAFSVSHYGWAVVTGVGVRWSRYRLDSNSCFQKVDGTTSLHPAPDGIHYKTSKLNIRPVTMDFLVQGGSVIAGLFYF